MFLKIQSFVLVFVMVFCTSQAFAKKNHKSSRTHTTKSRKGLKNKKHLRKNSSGLNLKKLTTDSPYFESSGENGVNPIENQ